MTLSSASLTAHPGLPFPVENTSTRPGNCLFPQGPPRYEDPSGGNFFQMRPHEVPDPASDSWPTTDQRIGSWGDVIDAITPGATLDFIRYAFQYRDKAPKIENTSLVRITFDSCGYLCLPLYQDFNQSAVGPVLNGVTNSHGKRTMNLYDTMMKHDDPLLGEITPTSTASEVKFLTTGFAMRFGWEDLSKAIQNREDGQLPGGYGRFSGSVEKLSYSPGE